MPTKIEKDAVTGTMTTGHEWDGIRELNTPLPKWWLWVFYACIAWSLGYFVLYPTLPGVGGWLGWSQRAELADRMAAERARVQPMLDRIRTTAVADIPRSGDLHGFAIAGGRAAFADNCAPCHGAGAAGAKGGFRRWSTTNGSGAATSTPSAARSPSGCAAPTPIPASRRCPGSAWTAC